MKRAKPMRKRGKGEEGYALTLVVFLLALVVIASATMVPDVITNGRREKEEEMIWRGKQYVRGIRLYVRYAQAHGGQARFPTSMEDLTKNKVGIRFMRQAYKDPVNDKDGSWRLIYVGPNGQLIGSLKAPTFAPGADGGSAVPFGSSVQSTFGNGSNKGSAFNNSSFGGGSSLSSGANNGAIPGQAGAADASGAVPTGDGTTDQLGTPQAIATSDAPTEVIGGSIIGVGSKVNRKSVIWYDKAKNYRQFEFVWDPSKEPLNGGAVSGVPGQVAPGGLGGNSIFSNPSGTPGAGQAPTGTAPGSSPGTGTPPMQNTPQ